MFGYVRQVRILGTAESHQSVAGLRIPMSGIELELSAWLIRTLAGPEAAEKVLASVQPVGSQVMLAQ